MCPWNKKLKPDENLTEEKLLQKWHMCAPLALLPWVTVNGRESKLKSDVQPELQNEGVKKKRCQYENVNEAYILCFT